MRCIDPECNTKKCPCPGTVHKFSCRHAKAVKSTPVVMYNRYFVNDVEVTKEEYVAAERRNGFRNTLNQPDEPATSSFSNSETGDRGRQTYERQVE